MADVTDFEEFERWIEGKSKGTRYHYKASLQKFCDFHGTDPRKLINEAKNWEPADSETSHLEENPADRRLRNWHVHLVTPKCPECGERVDEDDAECSECGSRFGGPDRVSKNTASTYWRHIKAFYERFGVEITAETPSVPRPKNEKPDYDAADVRKMVDGAKSLRDRAIVLTAFQGGMDPVEICRLDYGQVRPAVEGEREHYFVRKTRKKTGVSHHVPLSKDAIEALKLYTSQMEGEIEDDDPLFVKRNGDRITPSNIQFVMRKINERVGDQIREARTVDTDINPLSLKYLRRAFSIACRLAKVEGGVREYWMGHATDYGGAYDGRQVPKPYQERELEKVEPYLSITAMREEYEERERKQDEKIRELRAENHELWERLEGQDEMRKNLRRELLELYRREIFPLISDLRELGFRYSDLKEMVETEAEREVISDTKWTEESFSASPKENSPLCEEDLGDIWRIFLRTQLHRPEVSSQLTQLPDLSQFSLAEIREFRDRLIGLKELELGAREFGIDASEIEGILDEIVKSAGGEADKTNP